MTSDERWILRCEPFYLEGYAYLDTLDEYADCQEGTKFKVVIEEVDTPSSSSGSPGEPGDDCCECCDERISDWPDSLEATLTSVDSDCCSEGFSVSLDRVDPGDPRDEFNQYESTGSGLPECDVHHIELSCSDGQFRIDLTGT